MTEMPASPSIVKAVEAAIVASAHTAGLWIRFYTLNGVAASEGREQDWSPSYNFGSAEAVERKLLSLEAQALQKGASLGAGFAYPVTLDAVTRWSQGLAGRGYQLAPASAVVRR